MTVEVVFDAAHLSDAISKASRIAPSKSGASMDKAGGILISLMGSRAKVHTTNLEVCYWQDIPIIKNGHSGAAVWRLPTALFSSLTAALQLEGGDPVQIFEKGDNWLRLKQGSFVAKIPTLDAKNFPIINLVNPEGMVEANDFASKIEQVVWAADNKGNDKMSGVHIDGQGLYATDRYVLAYVPCVVALDEPTTTPMQMLAPILKQATDTRVRVSGNRFEIQLDRETFATSTVFADPYPNVKPGLRTTWTGELTFDKERFLNVVNRMLLVVSSDKLPALEMTIDPDNGIMSLDILSEGVGQVRDTVGIKTEYTSPMKLTVTPDLIKQGINACKANSVTMRFGHENPAMIPKSTLILLDGSGFEAHISPRIKQAEPTT